MKYIDAKIQGNFLWRRGIRGKYLTSYLHIYGGDSERTERFHNHPWKYAVSIVLWKGFDDEHIIDDRITSHKRRMFSIKIYNSELRHRLANPKKGTISLFFGIMRTQHPMRGATIQTKEGYCHYTEFNGFIDEK